LSATMSPLQIEILPIFADNYIYLLRDADRGVTGVVDPGDAAPVLARLGETGWKLDWILSTHHHQDHTGGNLELKRATGCRIAGPAGERDAIPGLDLALSEGDRFELGSASATILETPGHTRGHISYWFEQDGALFCADTLFALGCGRVFEGTPPQMWASLSKLAALPDSTRVYCGHEYTQSNARFAVTVDPDNSALARRAAEVERLRAAGQPTIPSTLGEERATNPFLRAGDPGIRRVLGLAGASDAEVFAEIRRRKDRF
jgi:hydroxyacylglutathione hydrolase